MSKATKTHRFARAHVGLCAPISIVPTSPRVYWSELRSFVHSKPVDMEAVEDLIDLAPLELRHELRVYARANGWKSPRDERLVEEALERSGQGHPHVTLMIDGVEYDVNRHTWWHDMWPSHEIHAPFMNPREQASYTPLTEWDSSSSTPLEDLMAFQERAVPRDAVFIVPGVDVDMVHFDMSITANPEEEGDFTITLGWEEE